MIFSLICNNIENTYDLSNVLLHYIGEMFTEELFYRARAPPIGVVKEKLSLTYNLYIHMH